MTLSFGENAPWFSAPTPTNPEFVFDSAAGRYVLMLFLPNEAEARLAALRALSTHQPLFDDDTACAFVVITDPAFAKGLKDTRGLRWLMDVRGAITARYGPEPHWLLLDPCLRAMATAPLEDAEAMFARITALPAPADHAGTALHAPVLIAPRIFEPELCEALIALHTADGGTFTGVMRDQGDRTIAVMDELKRRRDVLVTDPVLVDAIQARLQRRLFPLIHQALGFSVTHIERFLVSCYDTDDGGVFRPHRDSTTQGTAHRRFACSINLNSDFEGGDLRFAEFGTTTYRPPAGGAVVFSCALMHEALPMQRGRRYAFLPFFFDDAAAAVRAAYEARTREPAA